MLKAADCNIREVIRNGDHLVAVLNVSGERVVVGYDETDCDPSVYVALTDVDPNHKVFMSPCETSLFIAALVAAHCQIVGKGNE